MFRLLLITLLISFTTTVFSQKSIDEGYYEYQRLMAEGDSLYKAKQYIPAAKSYAAVSKVIYNNEPIRSATAEYNAACSWALGGQPDSAFHHLSILTNRMNHTSEKQLNNDKDFNSLHNDKRWKEVLKATKRNREKEIAYQKRITYNEDKHATIFNPLTEQAKKYLTNDTLPFISVSHGHYRIFFRGDSYAAKKLDELKQAFTEAYDRALLILGIDDYTRGINILVLSGKEEMKELTGMSPAGGFAMPGHDLVLFNFHEKTVAAPLTHEIFHLISIQTWGASHRMLQEGSAVYAQKECEHLMDNSVYSINAYMHSKNQLYPINDLVNHFNETAKKDEVGAYFQSAGIFKYLFEKYGVDSMKKLWQKGFKQFENIYGFSLDRLEKEWKTVIASTPVPENVDWENLFSNGCQELSPNK
jgi:hypothetical protein